MEECVKNFPDYFWEIPASKKHHHPDERKPGGLVLHVKRLAVLTDNLAHLYDLSDVERDILIAACILHDSFARGVPPDIRPYSDPMHPYHVEHQFPQHKYPYLPKRIYNEIISCVVSQHGRFSLKPYIDTKLSKLFQIIDFIGSRKNIKIEV